jgi:hypothetical protein
VSGAAGSQPRGSLLVCSMATPLVPGRSQTARYPRGFQTPWKCIAFQCLLLALLMSTASGALPSCTHGPHMRRPLGTTTALGWVVTNAACHVHTVSTCTVFSLSTLVPGLSVPKWLLLRAHWLPSDLEPFPA